MHSPKAVAFEIYFGKKKKKDGHYRSPIITIWHNDPETDGSDDSCGWFIRPRHCDQEILANVEKEFDYNFKNNYWFDKQGKQIYSTIGTLMQMYECAAWIHFKHNRRKKDAFMEKHCASIIHLAENHTDCIGDGITGIHYNKSELVNPRRFEGMAGIIYSDILRKQRKWYQHPKWHIWHWDIQFNVLQRLRRRFFDKCCLCKRGFTDSPISDGRGLWHEQCYAVRGNSERTKN